MSLRLVFHDAEAQLRVRAGCCSAEAPRPTPAVPTPCCWPRCWSPGTWQETAVRRHARALLDAATALPLTEHPRGVGELRTALVNAGNLGAARG